MLCSMREPKGFPLFFPCFSTIFVRVSCVRASQQQEQCDEDEYRSDGQTEAHHTAKEPAEDTPANPCHLAERHSCFRFDNGESQPRQANPFRCAHQPRTNPFEQILKIHNRPPSTGFHAFEGSKQSVVYQPPKEGFLKGNGTKRTRTEGERRAMTTHGLLSSIEKPVFNQRYASACVYVCIPLSGTTGPAHPDSF